ncbi:hypothetical protein GCM10007276_03700 [Agaricicola taiwanensis]|uniref:Uncharacterized protein n=1 Tax=Agaricicola taiwanensis TaxID=591372 RepID=A0A8J2VK94_9RHOB|nr:hypothetical protein GCM10007276_03700 [Agaricicola taiwanensis]
MLGDAASYRQLFDTLQDAVRKGDRTAVASLVRFPINVRIDGRRRMIADPAGFAANYERIVTPEIAAAITSQRWEDVHVSQRGIMLGRGEVWLNGICHDTMCRTFDARVVTIQSVGDAPTHPTPD